MFPVSLRRGHLKPLQFSPLLPIMRCNVSMNNLCDNVKVAELNWSVCLLSYLTSCGMTPLIALHVCFRGSPIPPEIPRPDLILAADCVYFEPTFPLLVQTLADLADATTEILFCYKKRRKVLATSPKTPSQSSSLIC